MEVRSTYPANVHGAADVEISVAMSVFVGVSDSSNTQLSRQVITLSVNRRTGDQSTFRFL